MQADAKSLAFLRVCFGYVSGVCFGVASGSASGSASGVPHIPLPFRWWTPQKCIHPYTERESEREREMMPKLLNAPAPSATFMYTVYPKS